RTRRIERAPDRAGDRVAVDLAHGMDPHVLALCVSQDLRDETGGQIGAQPGERGGAVGLLANHAVDRHLPDTDCLREVDGPQGSVSSLGSPADPDVEPKPVNLRCGDLAGSGVLEKLAKHALLHGERTVRSELELHEDYERPGFPVRRLQIWTE